MSKPMDMYEFANLLNHIRNFHSPFTARPGVRVVKYIDPHIDMRTNTVFSIRLRTFGGEAEFHCQNECRDIPESLLDRCMAWLTEK